MNKFKIVLMVVTASLLLQSCGGSYLIADIVQDEVRTNWGKSDFGKKDINLNNQIIYIDEINAHIGGSCDYVINNLGENKCFYVADKSVNKYTKPLGKEGLLIYVKENHKKTMWRINYKITVTKIETDAVLDEWITPYMQKLDMDDYLEEYFELLSNEIK